MALRIIILGCGSSGGVPRVGGDWGICDPNEPKNRRSRCSVLVQAWQGDGPIPTDQNKITQILVDSSPDLREQLIKAGTQRLDSLFYTHDHADQSHGIDDLRAVAYRMRARIPTYMDAHTKTHVWQRFKYCFELPEGRVHPPILELQPLIDTGDIVTISGGGGDITVETLTLSHGPTPSLGFIFNNQIAYSPDVWDIDDKGFEQLQDIPCWIVDSLRYNDHPTHAHADKALSWLSRAQARRGILTNLHIDMDYNTLKQALLPFVQPAYDGMIINS